MRKLLCLAMLVAGVASAEILITQPGGGGGGGGGSDPVAQAAAAAAQATANAANATGALHTTQLSAVVTGAVFSATGTQPSVSAGLLSIPTNGLGGGGSVPAGTLTNGNLTIGYSNNMLYFNVPLSSCTGFVFNVGGTNILLKQVNP